jgi:hypothetical protein
MSVLLAGMRGFVNTLYNRITSGRGTNLANLDATISSRAPASTALDATSVWTASRAAKLDLLRYGTRSYTDPRKLPLYWQRQSVSLFGDTANTPEDTAFWTNTRLTNSVEHYVGQVTAGDTYVTIVNVNGTGVFVGVMGPDHQATSNVTTTFRITVDGRVYTIAATLTNSFGYNPRLVLWCTELWLHETSASGASDGVPVLLAPQPQPSSLMTPRNAVAFGYGHVFFDTSLKVEVKISSLPTVSYGYERYCLTAFNYMRGSVA